MRAFLSLLAPCSATVLFEKPEEVSFQGHDYGSSTGWVYSFSASSQVQWGRLFYKMSSVDTSVWDGYAHVTLVELENVGSSTGGTQAVRIVDSVGSTKLMRESPSSAVQHLLNIDTGYDGEVGKTTAYSYSWSGDWVCLEWTTDSSKQHAALYEAGQEAFAVDDWTFQGNSQSHHYTLPESLEYRIGMYTYNGIAVSGSFKDVVVSTERVGCGSGPSPAPTPTPPAPTPSPAPTPPPAPTPSPGHCAVYKQQDCQGGDLSHTPASSPDQCCSLCAQASGCTAWTFAQYDGAGQHNPTCYLKSGCASRSACGSCTAGTLDRVLV
jgi:hypothetical protein